MQIKGAGSAIALSLLAGCYTVRNADMFAVQTAPVAPDRLAALSTNGVIVDSLTLAKPLAGGAYRIRIPAAHGTAIFFGGNGNEMEPVIKLLAPRAVQLGLNFVILNYWTSGQPQPDTLSTTQAVNRLIDQVIKDSNTPVCVVGHSLGAWFALQAAQRPDLTGAVLAAVGTTPSDLSIAQAGIWRPFLWHSAEDESLRSLDGVALAMKAVTPTLVVTSSDDEAIPAELSKKVFAALPPALPQQLLVLHGVSHGGYLRNDQFWQAAASYLCRGPDAAATPSRASRADHSSH